MRYLMLVFITIGILLLAFVAFASPVMAQGYGREKNIRTWCVRLPGLQFIAENIVNEMQLYNRSTDIYNGQGDCSLVSRPFTTDQSVAMGNGVRIKIVRALGLKGWIVTDRWLIELELAVALDKGKEPFWRPGDIYSREQWTLHEHCFRLTRTESGITIYGQQFDGRGRYCQKPILISN